MPHIDKHAPGAFAWIELATTDQSGAKTFYPALFGWTPMDYPMGPDDYYTMFMLEGKDAGAACTLGAPEKALHIPPHWKLYIAVESAEATAARATELGATVLAGPFDVMTHGRMAVIRDPAGAVFCLWEPGTHQGIGISNQHGAFCWADLNAPASPDAIKFYEDLFGYTAEGGGGGYVHIRNGEAFIGGVPPAAALPPGIPPHWMIYIQVDDCASATVRAKDLGAKICMGPMDMPNVGTMTVLEDPQGAPFALFQPASRS
jgi:hypothetical protein